MDFIWELSENIMINLRLLEHMLVRVVLEYLASNDLSKKEIQFGICCHYIL